MNKGPVSAIPICIRVRCAGDFAGIFLLRLSSLLFLLFELTDSYLPSHTHNQLQLHIINKGDLFIHAYICCPRTNIKLIFSKSTLITTRSNMIPRYD